MIEIWQIEENLAKLPHKIRLATKDYIEAKEVTEKAKLTLKVATSQAILQAQGTNAAVKQAEASIRTQSETLALIEAQKEEALKENELNYLNNKFVGVRKIASLTQEQLKSQIHGQ